MEYDLTQVTCYAGRTSAERPTSFLWKGRVHRVRKIEGEWREPGAKRFRLRSEDDRLFELCYYEGSDRWLVQEWVVSSAKGGRDEQGSP
jgi:Domain of unknown function (DUF6504)